MRPSKDAGGAPHPPSVQRQPDPPPKIQNRTLGQLSEWGPEQARVIPVGSVLSVVAHLLSSGAFGGQAEWQQNALQNFLFFFGAD